MFRSFVPALVAPLFLAVACAPAVDEATASRVAPGPVATVRAAPDQVAAMATGRVTTTFTIGDAPDEVSFTGTATFDDAVDRMALTLEMGALAGPEGPGASVFDGPLEMVVDGKAGYVRGALIEAITGHPGWLAATEAELGRVDGVLGLPGACTDPRQLVGLLRGVGEVEARGHTDVRGVRTTRYDTSVDLAEAIPGASLDDLPLPRGDVPISVWIDADGLVRRLRLVLVANPLGGAAGRGQLTTVMELFDYGEPVAIEVPPPAEVTTLGDVAG